MKKALVVMACLALSAGAYAEDIPRGSVVDDRVKTLMYGENQVYKLTAYFGYQIDVVLADNETVKTVAAGDTIGWQIVNADHHLFIKPMARDARTNLSVITDKRTYIFDLNSKAAVNPDIITYLVRFKYPETQWAVNPVSRTDKSLGDFNFKYVVSGAKEIKPTRVFDDGQFTYFQFDDKKDIPAIFIEGGSGQESLVNYRMEKGYVVVERLGDFFTLRDGKRVVTVMSESLVPPEDN